MRRNITILLSSLFFLSEACGQVKGPMLEAGDFEIGYFQAWYRRNLDKDSPVEFKWCNDSFFIGYGISRYSAIFVEAMVRNFYWQDHPECDYREYIIGVGAAAALAKIKSNRILAVFHFREWLGFDRARSRYHKNHRNVTVSAELERSFIFHKQQISLWGGPAFVYDEIKQYPGLPYIPYVDESFDNLGFVLGISCLVKEHISPSIFAIYADYFQPRASLGYRF
jgi:hypothetical protein